jgi:hypothetical protein
MHEAQRIYQERAGKRYEKKVPAVEEGLSPVGETVVAVLAAQIETYISLTPSGTGPGSGLPGSGGAGGRPGKPVQPQDQRRRLYRDSHGSRANPVYRGEKSGRGPGARGRNGGLGEQAEARSASGPAPQPRHGRRLHGPPGHPGAGVACRFWVKGCSTSRCTAGRG